MAQRITKSMTKDELYDEGRTLESEIAILHDNVNELEGELEDLKGIEEELHDLKAQQEDDRAADALVEGAETARKPNIRLAISNLRKYDQNGGVPHLRQAERFIRTEIVRLRGDRT